MKNTQSVLNRQLSITKQTSGNIILFSLLCMTAACYVARVIILNGYEINWDEFYFLSKIYSADRGELSSSLQTIYVQFFGWLISLRGIEVEQVIYGRYVMLVLQICSSFLLYLIAKSLFNRSAAVFCVLFYSSYSYVLLHGASFRADPILGFLMIAALYLIAKQHPKNWQLFTAGFCLAMAALVSVKAVLLAPSLIGIAIIQTLKAENSPRIFIRYAGIAFTTVILFLLLYFLNKYMLAGESNTATVTKIVNKYPESIQFANIFPRSYYFLYSFNIDDKLFYFVLVGGFLTSMICAIRPSSQYRYQSIFCLACALPLFCLLFYKNAYPYFYPFILLPASLLFAQFWSVIIETRRWQISYAVLFLLATLQFIGIYDRGISYSRLNNIEKHQQLLDVIHRMYPEPVSYIDRNSMVSSFPKAGFFMTTWGVRRYIEHKDPVISKAYREKQPLFVIDNVSYLSVALRSEYDSNRLTQLLPEDSKVLRENYIHHWGPIYVLGKNIKNVSVETITEFQIEFTGPYHSEAQQELLIDSQVLKAGQRIILSQGSHTIRSTEFNTDVNLLWGDDLYRETSQPISQGVYSGFLGVDVAPKN